MIDKYPPMLDLEASKVADWLRTNDPNGSIRGLCLESAPVEMLLYCPECKARHYDEGIWRKKHHHTHACQHCGFVWRPAVCNTVGVKFLNGFKNDDEEEFLSTASQVFKVCGVCGGSYDIAVYERCPMCAERGGA